MPVGKWVPSRGLLPTLSRPFSCAQSWLQSCCGAAAQSIGSGRSGQTNGIHFNEFDRQHVRRLRYKVTEETIPGM